MTLMSTEVRRAFYEKVNVLRQAGYEIQYVDMPWDDSFVLDDTMIRFIRAEMSGFHKEIFNQYKYLYHTSTAGAIRHGQTISPEFVKKLREGQSTLRNELKATMQTKGINIWISPAQGGTAPEGYDRTGWTGMTAIWSYTGFPTITIPVMEVNQMPLGFQCIGDFYADEEVTHVANILAKELSV